MPKYEVPIVYKGQCNFIVEANSPEEAAEIARNNFRNGERPDELGNEWERIDRIGDIEKLPNEENPSPKFLETLAHWRNLRNVPTRQDAVGVNRLDVPFEDFPVGTDIEAVWHALEADCPEFSVGDAMSGKYAHLYDRAEEAGEGYVDDLDADNRPVRRYYSGRVERLD